ncbi:hypothetical protein FNAPI_368 [Fusarium napiforme]|uniref:Uncharacterized protein n=1 Tax=Fusarium napiforme TaxID=42672 RepID=A0A8H5NKK8_9HYPO|nr:hypothetical protein FNAPI_368 [Fusarium napiforme]
MGLFDFLTHRPSSPPKVEATKSWKVDLMVESDPDILREEVPMVNLTVGWQAQLVLHTSDIIGLMREGLHVSQHNVIVQENCLTMRPYQQEHNKYYYDRHFALTGPSWKGNLVVTTLSCPVATNFRVEHLSPDKVYRCYVSDDSKTECWAYNFAIEKPDLNANYILDDTPLKGLWPWPRKEPFPRGMEKEREKERIEEGDMLDLL